MSDFVKLKTPVQLLSFASPTDTSLDRTGGNQALYRNPCLQFLGREVNQMVASLPKQVQATPGRYFVKSTKQIQNVSLFVGKCPDGTIQNTRQSICEARPGKDLKQICLSKYPLTGKSEIEMLQMHLASIQQNLTPQ